MKLVYPIILYPMEEHEGGYTVEVPDLPGCVTEGHDLADALDMARDAASGAGSPLRRAAACCLLPRRWSSLALHSSWVGSPPLVAVSLPHSSWAGTRSVSLFHLPCSLRCWAQQST